MSLAALPPCGSADLVQAKSMLFSPVFSRPLNRAHRPLEPPISFRLGLIGFKFGDRRAAAAPRGTVAPLVLIRAGRVQAPSPTDVGSHE